MAFAEKDRVRHFIHLGLAILSVEAGPPTGDEFFRGHVDELLCCVGVGKLHSHKEDNSLLLANYGMQHGAYVLHHREVEM